MIETRNAVIASASLSNGDHGMLSGWLHLDYGGSGQGFGGYILYVPGRRLDNTGMFIWRCMDIAGVSEWSQLKGKTLRVRIDNGLIVAIGHIVKDDWFTPSEDFK